MFALTKRLIGGLLTGVPLPFRIVFACFYHVPWTKSFAMYQTATQNTIFYCWFVKRLIAWYLTPNSTEKNRWIDFVLWRLEKAFIKCCITLWYSHYTMLSLLLRHWIHTFKYHNGSEAVIRYRWYAEPIWLTATSAISMYFWWHLFPFIANKTRKLCSYHLMLGTDMCCSLWYFVH